MKNLSQISDNKDIITKEYIVARYEPLLPTGTSGILKRASNGVWTLDTTALGDMTIAIYGGSASGIVAKSDALKETRAGATEKVWVGTKAQYNAIVTKDSGTCYITTDETYGSYISLDETGHILASYMPLSVSNHIASTSNPHGVTRSQVGLGNVDNTADIDKPISLYVQAALDLKAASNHTHANYALLEHTHSTYAPINSPTFTGTVSGITATMVGLGNVTNESKSIMLNDMTITGTTKIEEIIEQANLVATAYTAGANIDLKSGTVFYNTANATANPTFNFRGDGSNTLSSMLDIGKSITFTILITNNSTAYYPTAYTIDGTSVTPKWVGRAPSSGNTNAIDVYSYTIIKTAATPTYTVLASITKFA